MWGIHGGDVYRSKVHMDFSVNINPLGMPDSVRNTLKKAINFCDKYPDMQAEKLKKAVSSMLSVPQKYLLFGNGASELLMSVMHTIRPKKVMIPVPSFYGYEYAAEAVDSEILYVPLKEEDNFLPGEELLNRLTEEIELLFLANPNNPTGRLVSREYLKKVLDICRDKNIYVVLDECFIEFCGKTLSFIPVVEEYPNLLLLRAFTKIYAIPGVRLGYLVCGNNSLLQNVGKHLPEWNLSTFAQEAGIACVSQSAYVEKTVEYVKKEREFLVAGLKEIDLRVFPGEANFILVYSEKPLYEELLQRGILIRNCANFKGLQEGYYRIAVKQRKDNEKLLKVIGECIVLWRNGVIS